VLPPNEWPLLLPVFSAASGDIVVIAQDDKSAAQFGRWPWPRRHDAALINRLREMGAKTIVFNRVFAHPTNSVDDSAFLTALDQANGKVWLSTNVEEDKQTGKLKTVLPLPLFRSKSRQANSYVWYDAFGFTKNVGFSGKIGERKYISSAAVMASVAPSALSLRPDTAIKYNTIPTVSMVDVVDGNVDRSAIAGKSIIVGLTIPDNGDEQRILGQSASAPSVYTRVIAAETIKNGIARELGWLPPLIAVALVGLYCVSQRARRRRAWLLVGGGVGLLGGMLIGDRIGLHFEIVPALLLLSTFAVREGVKRKVVAATTTHPISGLPNLTELYHIKGRETCTILALKVEQYQAVIGNLPAVRQRELIHAVAARIGIVCPNSIVHQGDDGLFVWLIPHGSEGDIDTLPGQLLALFMVDISDSYEMRMIGVSVGRSADLSLKFGERLAVTNDRAIASAYITLRQVL